MSDKKQVPIVEGLFTWPSTEPKLIGSKCKKCGSVMFPKAVYCPNPDCEKKKENVEVVELNRKGKLWSFTTQEYLPPTPFRMEPFSPYVISMVDLPEGLRVLGILTGTTQPKPGMDVELTVGKLYEDAENEYVTWMWKPAAGGN